MEQAKWTGFFKVVKPAPEVARMTDNMALDSSAYTNYSWYQRIVHGASSRFVRYNEYEQMDQDVDVARAIDLVAEEMTNKNGSTGLPLNLNLTTDLTTSVPPNLVSTLRVALKHWCLQRGFDVRLFNIARNLIKYGDVFFKRVRDEEKKVETWEYVNPKNVMGAAVNKRDVTHVLGWQIRTEIKEAAENGGGSLPSDQTFQTEVIPACDVVRFTMNDDMSDDAPFGVSVLADVYRVTKQKELLEDAIVIYRIQRAPERRVFYIDVGKMPPQRTKQYLEQVKNELRQKKVPSVHGGHNNIESTYNPQSMSEDFYFTSRPNGNNSRVEVLPGGQNLGELTDLEYFRQRVLEGLRIPPSYLPNMQSPDAATFSDDNVGTAYQPEIQFTKYCRRLQSHLNEVVDAEFKRFLKKIDVRIDPSLFTITLPEPTNFEKHKQAAVNGVLLGQFGNADGVQYLSKRFVLSKYLMLTPAEIAQNEALLAQERGLDSKQTKSMVTLYNPDMMDVDQNEMGGGQGGGGGLPGVDDMGDNQSMEQDMVDQQVGDDGANQGENAGQQQ